MRTKIIMLGSLLLLAFGCAPDTYETGTCVAVYENTRLLHPYAMRVKVSNELVRVYLDTSDVRIFDDVKTNEPMWYEGTNNTDFGWQNIKIHVHNAGDIKTPKLEKSDSD